MDFYSASSLKEQSVARHDAPLGSIIMILSQPVFALFLNAACLVEKQKIPIQVFDLTQSELETTILPHSR